MATEELTSACRSSSLSQRPRRERRRGSSPRCRESASRFFVAPTPAARPSAWLSAPSLLGFGDAITYRPPQGARFLTRDHISAITREPYGYVYNNPLNFTDPMGLGIFDSLGDAWDATGGPAVSYVDDHKVGILKGTSYVLALGAIAAVPVTGGGSLAALPTALAFGAGGTAVAAEAFDTKPHRAQRVTLAAGFFMLGGGGVAGAFGAGGWPFASALTDLALLGLDPLLGRDESLSGEVCPPAGVGSW